MTHEQLKLVNLLSAMEADFPDFKIVNKQDSKLMKFLAKVLFFNKDFMTRYVTVIGQTVYVPSRDWMKFNPAAALITLSHEWVHMKDNRRWKFLYTLAYLSPQIFAILAPLGFWNPWFFLFALCLLPLPSLGRSEIELRGYTMTMAVRWWLYEKEPNYERISKYFTSSAYYWMYPVKDSVIEDLECNFERIKRLNLKPHEQHIFDTIMEE